VARTQDEKGQHQRPPPEHEPLIQRDGHPALLESHEVSRGYVGIALGRN
jgi:hypothetical protein